MIGQSKRPIPERAFIRAISVALILLVSIELLRFLGEARHVNRTAQLFIGLGGGAFYGAFWAASAALTARMMKKIADAASGEKK